MANGLSDLVDQSISNPINVTELGTVLTYTSGEEVATNTHPSGSVDLQSCPTSGGSAGYGFAGRHDQVDQRWSRNDFQYVLCATDRRYYCFEQ